MKKTITPYKAKCLLDKGYNYVLVKAEGMDKIFKDEIVSVHKNWDTAFNRFEKHLGKYEILRTIEYLFPHEKYL